MLDLTRHRGELEDRLKSARDLVISGELTANQTMDISRETRGLAVVLIFAAYENLLKSMCTSVLEEVAASRAGNRRLKPGYKVFATATSFQGLFDAGSKHLWTGRGFELMELVHSSTKLTVSTTSFPSDGSYMKRSQVKVICDLFEFGNPASIMGRMWSVIDTIVKQRNAVAHGQLRADEVGRRYTYLELLALIEDWRGAWLDFLNWVESQCKSSDFFLLPR